MRDVLRRPYPSIYELILVYIFTFAVTIGFTIFDINVFDGYVLQNIIDNWQSADQLEAGDLYWSTFTGLFLLFGGMLFVTRLVLGILAGAKLTVMLFFIAFMWGFSSVALIYFGWIDTLYYEVKGEEIPAILDHLDNTGLFVYVKHLGETDSVDKSDLYLLNALGILLLAGIWFKLMYLHHKKHLRRIGIHH